MPLPLGYSIESVSKEFLAHGILPVATDNEYDAIQYVLGGQNKILLLEVVMAENKGLDILKWIRWKEKEKNLSDIPVVMFSDNIDSEIHDRALKLGVLEIVISPSDMPEKIAKQINEILIRLNS